MVSVTNHEAALDEVLEYCNEICMAPIPEAAALPEEFTGTLGHFPAFPSPCNQ